jgi:hypothetical protein
MENGAALPQPDSLRLLSIHLHPHMVHATRIWTGSREQHVFSMERIAHLAHCANSCKHNIAAGGPCQCKHHAVHLQSPWSPTQDGKGAFPPSHFCNKPTNKLALKVASVSL